MESKLAFISQRLDEARAFYKKSEFYDAELIFKKIVKDLPTECSTELRTNLYIELGEALLMQGNFAKAEKSYATAIKLVKDGRMKGICYVKLADAFFMQKKLSEAKNHYEMAFKSFQDDMMCLCFIKLENAVDIVEEVNMKGVCSLKLGDALYMTEEYANSMEYYRKAINLFQDSKMKGLCHLKLGDALVMAGDIDEADEYYGTALKLFKDLNIEGVCQLKLGDASFKRGKFSNAEQYYEKAIESCKKTREEDFERQCYIRLGAALGQMGRFIEARDILLKALSIKPNYHRSSFTYPINQKSPVGAPIIVIPPVNLDPKPTKPSYHEGEIDEDDALIYSILAEVSYYLGEKEKEKWYRSILKNIDLTLETIEKAKEKNYLTGYIIKRYVTPCGDEVKQSYKGEKIYQMTKKVRGLCLILNNTDFEENQEGARYRKRKGAEIDEANMSNVFKQLNFTIETAKNLEAEDLKKTVRKWVNEGGTEGPDAFVLVIMSHGTDNMICGTVGTIKLHDILVEAYSSEKLKGKPKVAIIQACKGDYVNKSEGNKQCLSEDDVDKLNEPVSGKYDNAHDMSDSSGAVGTRVIPAASTRDCFMMYATIDGFSAKRIPGRGSPFIAALTQALFEHSHTKHIAEIFEEVKKLMKKVDQVPGMVDCLEKQMYFIPECTTDETKI